MKNINATENFFSTISFVLYQFDENSKWKLSSSSSSPNWIESKNYQDVYCKDCGRSKFICGWLIHHRHYHYQEKLTCVGVIIHKHKHIYILKNNFGIFLRFMKKNAGILMHAYLSLRRKCEKKTFDCFCVCVCVLHEWKKAKKIRSLFSCYEQTSKDKHRKDTYESYMISQP